MRKLIMTILLFSIFPISYADEHYIRVGAQGNNSGSNWENAYPTIPSGQNAPYVRGDTYWIAGGDYSAVQSLILWCTAESGTTPIYLKKAVDEVGKHGSAGDWNSAYGGQAILPEKCRFHSGYWVLDGQERSGWKSGYGFYILCTNGSTYGIGIGKDFHGSVTNVDVSYVEIEGPGEEGGNVGFWLAPYNATPLGEPYHTIESCDLSYCYIHDVGKVHFLMRQTHHIDISYCYCSKNISTTEAHGQGISCGTLNYDNPNYLDIGPQPTYITVKYNWWEDVQGTETISVNGQYIYVYGNVFFATHVVDSFHASHGVFGGFGADPYDIYEDDQMLKDAVFYNNTIMGYYLGSSWEGNTNSGVTSKSDASNNYCYNNLWLDCCPGDVTGERFEFTGFTHDYNWFKNCRTDTANFSDWDLECVSPYHGHKIVLGGNIFVNSDYTDPYNFNPRLTNSSATTPCGYTLSSPYNIDMDGIVRASDETEPAYWDHGAFEYVEESK